MSRLDPERNPDRPLTDALPEIAHDLSEDERRLLLGYVQGFHAADPARAGERALAEAEGAGESDGGGDSRRQFRIIGGYDRIIAQLALAVPDRVLLGHVVEHVAWSPGHVTATVRSVHGGGRLELRGRAAVITVPLGVLQAEPRAEGALRFDPPPSDHLAAAGRLVMGSVVRVAVRLREEIWSTGRTGAGGAKLSRMSFLHADAPIPAWWTLWPVHAPLLVGWSGGPAARALAARGQAAVGELALDIIAEHLRISRSDLDHLVISCATHDWDADPYTRGAYTYVPVGAIDAQRKLATPVENTLFFAGEATADGDAGTVHGAIDSGVKAAGEIESRGQSP